MTSTASLQAIVPLVADLARDLPEAERYRRLLQALRTLVPCDAAALLRLDIDALTPLAVDGLSGDTLGRRFRVADHPRLRALLAADGPLQFDADCPLPDPYDGLVDGVDGHLPVHDCMGCALDVDDRRWGLLTLDALASDRFSARDRDTLRLFVGLAAATVKVSERIAGLASRAEDARRQAEVYRLAAHDTRRALIGQSQAHQKLQTDIQLVGPTDIAVLITGETGVGKELVAQALHAASPRAHRPLVSLNCAALPDTLVESELFGHVRGAFSGAAGDRRGKFELADGGTLFLDEVGELPLAVQAKLLRVLQSGQLQRLGSDRDHRVDVRLIAATNRDLAAEVQAGRFRADVYHRLGGYPLRVPPLRERGSDILLLCGHFLEENRARLGLGGLRLAADAPAALLAYDWPGNVRELEHLIGRSVLKTLGRSHPRPRILTLHAADLALEPPRGAAPAARTHAPLGQPSLREATDRFQRERIRATLAHHAGNWSAAARELGLDRANLVRLAKRLGEG